MAQCRMEMLIHLPHIADKRYSNKFCTTYQKRYFMVKKGIKSRLWTYATNVHTAIPTPMPEPTQRKYPSKIDPVAI